MFGGPPPLPSKQELKAQEEEVASTLQRLLIGSLALYLSPFAVDYVKQLL